MCLKPCLERPTQLNPTASWVELSWVESGALNRPGYYVSRFCLLYTPFVPLLFERWNAPWVECHWLTALYTIITYSDRSSYTSTVSVSTISSRRTKRKMNWIWIVMSENCVAFNPFLYDWPVSCVSPWLKLGQQMSLRPTRRLWFTRRLSVCFCFFLLATSRKSWLDLPENFINSVMYLCTRKNWLNFESHSRLDPDPGIFKSSLWHCDTVHFFPQFGSYLWKNLS